MSLSSIITFNNMVVFALGFTTGYLFPLLKKFNKFLDKENKQEDKKV